MKLVDALTLTLKELGVTTIFGISGANIEHFHDAIYRLGGNTLRSVLTKNDASAAYMADGFARAHHTVGVCCSTSGGGMTNLAVGIAESYADEIPVLAIIGQCPTDREGQGSFQDSSGKNNTINALHFWKTITKYTAKIDRAEAFWPALTEAFRALFTKSYGPVALLIPRNLYECEVPPKPDRTFRRLSAGSLSDKPRKIDLQQALTRLFNALKSSKHPLLIVGRGTYTARSALQIFVNKTHLPVATTIHDVNAFPNDDPNYLGMMGIAGHQAVHDYIINEVDLLIAVGDVFSSLATVPSTTRLLKTIYIGENANKAVAARSIDLLIECEIAPFFEYFTAHYEPSAVLTHRKRERQHEHVCSRVLSTSLALSEIQPYLSRIQTLFFDAGNCVISALHQLRFSKNTQTHIALGMGGMGYAIAAGIGAQFGEGQHTAVITGDGGFLISGLEVHTAVEYQLPILFLVFNNNQHGMCVTRQQCFFDDRITASTYSTVHIATIAKGLGDSDKLWVACAHTRSDLKQQLADYYQNHAAKPGVLELKIAVDEMPPFLPFLEREIPT